VNTNQLLTAAFPEGDMHIWHLTGMGSLTDLFRIGNRMRAIEGKDHANMTHFVNSKATQEYINIICKNQGCTRESVVRTVGKGKASRTEANQHFLIYAAEYLSPELRYLVMNSFLASSHS